MHGVGWETAQRVFDAAGFDEPHVVEGAARARSDLPDRRVPQPRGAGSHGPRARRCGGRGRGPRDRERPRRRPARRRHPRRQHGWRRLTGNEVGSILGWRAAERTLDGRDDTGTLAASLVSSPALKEIARKYNLDFEDTLTGFKWISRVGGLTYGYEEALGYLVDPRKVRDKDGISAARRHARARGRAQGRGPHHGGAPPRVRREVRRATRRPRSRCGSTTSRRSPG